MSTELQLMTADELLALPRGEFLYELVDGELKKTSPAGHKHGRITMRLAVPLGLFVEKKKLGEVYSSDTGFKLTSDPDTVLAPDVAFVSKQRIREVGEAPGYWPGPPDLAMEVNSPSNTLREIKDKVADWLKFGTRLVWVVSLKLRNVTVYKSLTDVSILTENDTLEGGEVVPGFQISVAKIFAQ